MTDAACRSRGTHRRAWREPRMPAERTSSGWSLAARSRSSRWPSALRLRSADRDRFSSPGIIGIPLGIVLGSIHGIEARTGRHGGSLRSRPADGASRPSSLGDLVLGTIVTIGLAIGGLWPVLVGIVGDLRRLPHPGPACARVDDRVHAGSGSRSSAALPGRDVGRRDRSHADERRRPRSSCSRRSCWCRSGIGCWRWRRRGRARRRWSFDSCFRLPGCSSSRSGSRRDSLAACSRCRGWP